ncbi:MAG: hypothetical protein AAFU61_12390, partial [Pseudomonadota bacterium]
GGAPPPVAAPTVMATGGGAPPRDWTQLSSPLLSFGAPPLAAAARLRGHAIWVSVGPEHRDAMVEADAAVGALLAGGAAALCGLTIQRHAAAAWTYRRAPRGTPWPWPSLSPAFDAHLRRACGGVWVPDVPGWATSALVAEDVLWALGSNRRVMVEAASWP